MKFYIKRVNQVGNEFFLGLSGEWHHGSVAGPGGYKVVTYKTEAGAFRRADRFAVAYPGQRIVVMTDDGPHGTHEVVERTSANADLKRAGFPASAIRKFHNRHED